MHLGEQRHNASVAFVAGAPALDVQPYGLAVAKGNDALAIRCGADAGRQGAAGGSIWPRHGPGGSPVSQLIG